MTPESVRVAAQLPAPFVLSDYEPFQALGKGDYGMTLLKDATPQLVTEVGRTCQKAFAAGATCGYCLVPRVKAVFFDMDATVIQEESLVALAEHLGLSEHVARVTDRAMAGEIDFRQALTERVALLKGLGADVLPVVAERLTLSRGIQPFIAFCREVGVPTFLISGGFVQLAQPLVRKVGFTGFHANTLGVAAGKLTGQVDGDVVDADGKRRFLVDTCAKLGIQPAEVAAVGDGANDLPMLQAAGCAVGHKPKPVLVPHLHAVNAAGNHTFLAPLLFGRDVSILRSRGFNR